MRESTHRRYYWILARNTDGKRYLIFGSAHSEAEARQVGIEMLGGADFEIRQLHSRNSSIASRELKFGLLKDSHDLNSAAQRLGHERSVRRERARHSRLHRRR